MLISAFQSCRINLEILLQAQTNEHLVNTYYFSEFSAFNAVVFVKFQIVTRAQMEMTIKFFRTQCYSFFSIPLSFFLSKRQSVKAHTLSVRTWLAACPLSMLFSGSYLMSAIFFYSLSTFVTSQLDDVASDLLIAHENSSFWLKCELLIVSFERRRRRIRRKIASVSC